MLAICMAPRSPLMAGSYLPKEKGTHTLIRVRRNRDRAVSRKGTTLSPVRLSRTIGQASRLRIQKVSNRIQKVCDCQEQAATITVATSRPDTIAIPESEPSERTLAMAEESWVLPSGSPRTRSKQQAGSGKLLVQAALII